MTKPRTLRLQIPRPGKDGFCSDLCPMYAVRVSPYDQRRKRPFCAAYLLQTGAIRMIPGPGCPWGARRRAGENLGLDPKAKLRSYRAPARALADQAEPEE